MATSRAILTITVTAPAADCEEFGRATRAFVSGYQRTRVHESRLVRGEHRCLVANFNGAIPASRSIASATFRNLNPGAVAMSNPRIIGREAGIDITAQWGIGASIKCEVVLDNGEAYNQLFVIRVRQSPWFPGEATPQTGPSVLSVTAG